MAYRSKMLYGFRIRELYNRPKIKIKWGDVQVNDSETAKSSKEEISPEFLNMVTIFLMYGVILLFYAQKMTKFGPGNRGPEIWLDTLVEAVGISTFTYVLPATFQNFQRLKDSLIKKSILLLICDVLYVLVYALFPPRPLWLNIILCIFTIVLVFWTSHMIYEASNSSTSGQANEHMMKPASATRSGEGINSRLSEDSENNRIT